MHVCERGKLRERHGSGEAVVQPLAYTHKPGRRSAARRARRESARRDREQFQAERLDSERRHAVGPRNLDTQPVRQQQDVGIGKVVDRIEEAGKRPQLPAANGVYRVARALLQRSPAQTRNPPHSPSRIGQWIMETLLTIVAFVIVWTVLQSWLLPKFGVPT